MRRNDREYIICTVIKNYFDLIDKIKLILLGAYIKFRTFMSW